MKKVFFMKRFSIFIVLLMCVFFKSVFATDTLYKKNDCKSQIEQFNKDIEYLEDLKRGLEGRAIRYENQAQRLQFEKDQQIESRRLWNMAEQNRQAAAELDKKITEKKMQKEKYIKENNCEKEAKIIDQTQN